MFPHDSWQDRTSMTSALKSIGTSVQNVHGGPMTHGLTMNILYTWYQCSLMRLSVWEPYTLPQEEQRSSASLNLSFLSLRWEVVFWRRATPHLRPSDWISNCFVTGVSVRIAVLRFLVLLLPVAGSFWAAALGYARTCSGVWTTADAEQSSLRH